EGRGWGGSAWGGWSCCCSDPSKPPGRRRLLTAPPEPRPRRGTRESRRYYFGRGRRPGRASGQPSRSPARRQRLQGSRRRGTQPRRGERRDGTVVARLQRGDGAPVARPAARAEGRGGAGAEGPWTDPGGLAREGARTVPPHEAGRAKLVGGGDGEAARRRQTGL